jgi:peptidoglycan hydrolase-like protein with peptidoglycan-binding domain
VWVAPEWNDLTPKEKALRTGGNTVVINHVDIHTAYFHGRNQSRLRVGQKIKTGDHIFTSGTTGASTGNHLHFEVRRQQAQSTHMDPVPFLPGGTPVPPTPTKLVEDGILGKATWSAVQRLLTEKGFYKGPITGNPGRNTVRALQKALNEKAL